MRSCNYVYDSYSDLYHNLYLRSRLLMVLHDIFYIFKLITYEENTESNSWFRKGKLVYFTIDNVIQSYRTIYFMDKNTNITECYISASSDDLARNKPAIKKSDWSSTYVAGKAVDGHFNSYSCTTTLENYPYWSVDLSMSTFVDHLYITNVWKTKWWVAFTHRIPACITLPHCTPNLST